MGRSDNLLLRGSPNRRIPAIARPPAASIPIHSRPSGPDLATITEGPWDVSVSVALTGLPSRAGVTEAGLMAHVIPRGSEEADGHARATVPVKPRLGVTVRVAVPFCPAVTFNVGGELLIAKSGLPILMVTVPVETLP